MYSSPESQDRPRISEDRGSALAQHPSAPDPALFTKLTIYSRTRAWEITGGLSKPSKMPCYAWGTPASACQVGTKLASIQESVCAKCYALRGFFRQTRVQQAYQRRLDRWQDPEWIPAMVKLIYWQVAERGEPYFRWFDSGDLESVTMLQTIARVAEQTPEIQHWLPTREYRILAEYLERERPPPNLLIRVSAPLVDGPAPQHSGLPTSTVHSDTPPPDSVDCPARQQQPANCGDCRACWDPSVDNVSYPLH